MKAFRLNGMAIIAILFSISFTSCGDDYDDSIIIDRVDNLENRVTQLEEICKQINTNISSLQNIVAALENNDYVTSVTPSFPSVPFTPSFPSAPSFPSFP